MESYSNNRAAKMLEEIKIKREIMIDCANKKGFTNEETIKFSQELDELMNEYQRTFRSSVKSGEERMLPFTQMMMNLSKSILEI